MFAAFNAARRGPQLALQNSLLFCRFVPRCCVGIAKEHYADVIPNLPAPLASKLERLDSILVGIAHSKLHQRVPSGQGDRYNYLLRTYIFSAEEPYNLVAWSGLF